MGSVRKFMEHHFRHFNARETLAAARADEEHLEAGGKMLVTLAGAKRADDARELLTRYEQRRAADSVIATSGQ